MKFIYFLQAGPGGPIKIGISADPAARLVELQTGCPWPLFCLFKAEGSVQNERDLHAVFDEDRIHREWFHPSRPLLGLIEAAKVAGFTWPEPAMRSERSPPVRSERDPPLMDAIRQVGGISALAKIAGTTRQNVHQWRKIPPTFVVVISKMTGIPQLDLRPDLPQIFPIRAQV